MGPLWLPLGIVLAATLNGIVTYVLQRAPTLGAGFTYNAWYGIVVAAIVAGATIVVLFSLIRRQNAATLAAAQRAA